MRLDLSSIGVVVAATASALLAAWAGLQLAGPAQAEAMPVVRVAPEPTSRIAGGPAGPAQLTKSDDGHYWADAVIEGRAVRVMVDTGASVVALTRADARRLGLQLDAADFTGAVTTASGKVRAAPVSLRAVAVGSARVENVEALVLESGLPHSLLGMSYLGRLSTFTATPTSLTLRV